MGPDSLFWLVAAVLLATWATIIWRLKRGLGCSMFRRGLSHIRPEKHGDRFDGGFSHDN